MSFLFSRILKNVKLRIRKQLNRKNLYLSDNLYIDTFNYSDGSTKMYSIIGGEIYWWVKLDNNVVDNLLMALRDAFYRKSDITSVTFADGEFYIKKVEDVILNVILTGAFTHIASQSIKIERDMLEETIEQIGLL